VVDGKVSKREAIFRLPRADGNLCAPSAIFHPFGWKNKQG